MKIILYTVDMFKDCERLMPWRTIVEVCKFFNSQAEIDAVIVNATNEGAGLNRIYEKTKINCISKGLPTLINFIKEYEAEVLYYPVSFRDGIKSFDAFKSLPLKKIAYIPGGIYSLRGTLELLKISGLSVAKPYLLENIVPKNLLLKKLVSAGFKTIITLSGYTAKLINSKSWKKENTLISIPGNDSFTKLKQDDVIIERLKLKSTKFFLFSGAPAPIRGSLHLLKAFDQLAEEDKSVCLVMLMRKDITSDFSGFEKALSKIKNKEQIKIIRDTVTPNELKSIFTAAYSVILPFLLVPSEIPLTYFEVLSCGTPIITFVNGGTYDYVKRAVLGGKTGSIPELKSMMKRLWNDELLHRKLKESAFNLMQSHPTWEDTGKKWLQAIEK